MTEHKAEVLSTRTAREIMASRPSYDAPDWKELLEERVRLEDEVVHARVLGRRGSEPEKAWDSDPLDPRMQAWIYGAWGEAQRLLGDDVTISCTRPESGDAMRSLWTRLAQAADRLAMVAQHATDAALRGRADVSEIVERAP